MSSMIRKTALRAATVLTLALFAATSTPLTPSRAFAQASGPPCQARDALLSKLEQKYKEVPVAIGVSRGGLVELLTTDDGFTWTIILTLPKGVSCMVAAGEGWRPLTPASTDPAV